jgi:hypothetical protein
MTPSMAKNTTSSTSFGFQVLPGRAARRRPRYHAAANPMRYMMPYQCTRSGPTPNKGPISKATRSKPGYWSMGRRF